jgi:hypothetical protein
VRVAREARAEVEGELGLKVVELGGKIIVNLGCTGSGRVANEQK